jgi:hypothetical protein
LQPSRYRMVLLHQTQNSAAQGITCIGSFYIAP